MSYSTKLRRVADYDTQIKEIRNQLAEQLRTFDSHLDQKAQLLQDLSDYLRRRSEIEGEYARSLDKLADRYTSKIKRKESSSESVLHCWQVLLSQTRLEGKDHMSLSESFGSALPQQLSRCLEHVQSLAKKSKDICIHLQDELLKATTELQTTLKTYAQYHTEYLSAEGKLKEATKQEEKQKQNATKKMERLMEKRQCKVQETQLKCTKARNDYLLDLEAANSSMNKYYLRDLSSLIDVCDIGFHHSLSRVLQFYLSDRLQAQQTLGSGLQQLDNAVSSLDQNQDRDKFIQTHEVAFCMPLPFQYQPHEGDQVCEVSVDCEMKNELDARFQKLQSRLDTVNAENIEFDKTLQVSHAALLDLLTEDIFRSDQFTSQSLETSSEFSVKFHPVKCRASLQETENSYFMRIKEHLLNALLMSKLQAKHDLLKMAIQKAGTVDGQPRLRSKRSLRLKKSQTNAENRQKLFSGDMLSYIKASGEPIPLVVESCIRFINFHGMQHEGIFRVPGSQLEVNRLRDVFEKGENPLADEACDMDSVACVLKLYFRGMENPLFPKDSFDKLMECGRLEDDAEKVSQLKSVILSYPPEVIVVMRYLFAFLHHISQYSDENMMQPYNLAVCFGPSLIKAPEDADAAALHYINALVKTVIIHHESIFPNRSELEGPVYETCMSLETEDICFEVAVEDSEVELDTPNKVNDELEGVALYDYTARTTGELSFKQGGRIRLHSKASFDWWRGEVNGTKGLIPSSYIRVPSVERTQENKDGDKRNSRGSDLEEQTIGIPNMRPKVHSDKPGVSVSHAHMSKINLQIPTAQHQMQNTSPRALRKSSDLQKKPSAVDEVHVDKEVCQQMNSVFKELLARQLKDQLDLSVPAVQQKTTQRGRASSKPAEQMNK